MLQAWEGERAEEAGRERERGMGGRRVEERRLAREREGRKRGGEGERAREGRETGREEDSLVKDRELEEGGRGGMGRERAASILKER